MIHRTIDFAGYIEGEDGNISIVGKAAVGELRCKLYPGDTIEILSDGRVKYILHLEKTKEGKK